MIQQKFEECVKAYFKTATYEQGLEVLRQQIDYQMALSDKCDLHFISNIYTGLIAPLHSLIHFEFADGKNQDAVSACYREINALTKNVIGIPAELHSRITRLEAIHREKFLNVDGKDYEIVSDFQVMHAGWEMDEIGYVVKTDEGNKIVFLNHGEPYFASDTEVQNKMAEYKDAMDSLNSAIKMTNNTQSQIC